MIPEKFTECSLDHAEKEFVSASEKKAFVLGTHFAFGYLSPENEALRRILAVARMINNTNPDLRMSHALKSWDEMKRIES